MKLTVVSKSSLVALVCACALVGQSHAVDLAEAAEVMSEVESMSVSAKAAIAEAALGGDTEAIAEAQRRSDAIDAAVAEAREAFTGLEQAIQNNDMDAAESAEDDLVAALAQVRDALMGALPEEVVQTSDSGADSEESGDQTEETDDPPNIHEVPWKSEGIKAYYESLFGNWYNATAFGHGRGFGDGDATPE